MATRIYVWLYVCLHVVATTCVLRVVMCCYSASRSALHRRVHGCPPPRSLHTLPTARLACGLPRVVVRKAAHRRFITHLLDPRVVGSGLLRAADTVLRRRGALRRRRGALAFRRLLRWAVVGGGGSWSCGIARGRFKWRGLYKGLKCKRRVHTQRPPTSLVLHAILTGYQPVPLVRLTGTAQQHVVRGKRLARVSAIREFATVSVAIGMLNNLQQVLLRHTLALLPPRFKLVSGKLLVSN